MALLALDKVWINRLDTGEAISAPSAPDRGQTFATQLEVRTYANGRRRSISARGEQGTLTFRLVPVSRDTKDLLRTWAGVAVQVRDNRGQKWYGVFAGVDVGEFLQVGMYTASITLQTTTVTEEV